MDSKRVLLAIQEKLKWESRKTRIEEKLGQIRERKGQILRQIEETRSRVAQLTAIGVVSESERSPSGVAVRTDSLR
jgi:hypothetical protein